MGTYTTQKILIHNGKAVTLNGDKLLNKTTTTYYPSVTGGTEIIDGGSGYQGVVIIRYKTSDVHP